MTNLPAIPEPQTAALPALLDACDAVVAWADTCTDLAVVRDVYDRFAAVAEYLTRRNAASVASVAMRRLEVRIGQLLPPAEPVGRPAGNGNRDSNSVERHAARDFRTMAAHPDLVDKALAESTEEAPASRRTVLGKIAQSKLDAVKAAIDAEVRADAKREREEDAAFIASLTPPDYDPTFDRFSAAVCGAIIGAERGIVELAEFTADDIRRGLNHPNPKVREVTERPYLDRLAAIVAAIDKFRELT